MKYSHNIGYLSKVVSVPLLKSVRSNVDIKFENLFCNIIAKSLKYHSLPHLWYGKAYSLMLRVYSILKNSHKSYSIEDIVT